MFASQINELPAEYCVLRKRSPTQRKRVGQRMCLMLANSLRQIEIVLRKSTIGAGVASLKQSLGIFAEHANQSNERSRASEMPIGDRPK